MTRAEFMIVFGLMVILCDNQSMARPQDVQILRNDIDVRADGYEFAYETSDGTKREENSYPNADGSLSVQGSFSYIGDDGQTYSINFVADEDGYRAEGDHIPKGSEDFDESRFLPELPQFLPPSAILSLVGG